MLCPVQCTIRLAFLHQSCCLIRSCCKSWAEEILNVMKMYPILHHWTTVDLLHHWARCFDNLDMLSDFKIDRCIKHNGFGSIIHTQLHHLSDANESGKGAVTYHRMQNNRKDIHVAFLMGKVKLTPLKSVTIPRLELTAAVLAICVDLMLKAELRIPLQESVF